MVLSLQLDIHLDGKVVESLTEVGPDTPGHEAPPTWVDDEPAGKRVSTDMRSSLRTQTHSHLDINEGPTLEPVDLKSFCS